MSSPRETFRLEYVRLLGRLTTAMGLPLEERRRWSAQILELAHKAAEARGRWLWMTPAAADARHGAVLDIARDIAAMPPHERETFDRVVAELGATVIGSTRDAA